FTSFTSKFSMSSSIGKDIFVIIDSFFSFIYNLLFLLYHYSTQTTKEPINFHFITNTPIHLVPHNEMFFLQLMPSLASASRNR
ncbi:hypothetical protein QUF74_14370, partial [Candidatus Halobeggiatoa sp. HSG11]|nr:hypothetical protein [Candidatus Halobeggiatoa sp. HSG11]